MGEVWRARDPKLGRDVAIKVLPASLSENADRLNRPGGICRLLRVFAFFVLIDATDDPNVAESSQDGCR